MRLGVEPTDGEQRGSLFEGKTGLLTDELPITKPVFDLLLKDRASPFKYRQESQKL